jgi:hypothetical protein
MHRISQGQFLVSSALTTAAVRLGAQGQRQVQVTLAISSVSGDLQRFSCLGLRI